MGKSCFYQSVECVIAKNQDVPKNKRGKQIVGEIKNQNSFQKDIIIG